MKPKHVLPALLLAAAGAVHAQAPGLSEFQVGERADFPRLAADAGGFVVVWQDWEDPDHYQLVGRRFARDGEPVTGEVTLKPDFAGDATDVASDGEGRFVVVWSELEADIPHVFHHDVYAQRFSSAGAPLSGEIRLSAETAGDQSSPRIAGEAGGGFLAVWESAGLAGAGRGLFARRFTAAGEPLTGDLQANVATAGQPTSPEAAIGADGSFVVVWQLLDQPGIFARRFAAAGGPLTGDVQVNTFTSGPLTQPEVTVSADGGFVVVWRQTPPEPPAERGLFYRRFSAAGEPAGGAKRLSELFGSLAFDPGGASLLTFGYGFADDLLAGHFGQHFTGAGEPEGGAFRISPRFVPVFRGIGPVRAAGFGGGDYVAVYQLAATGGPFNPRSSTLYGRLLPREARAGTLSFAPRIPSDFAPGVDWAAVEGQTSVELTVLRSGGASGEAGVDYFLESGDANPGEDLSGTAGRLTFSEDELPWKSFAVEILDDDRPEDAEDAVFRLADPTGGALLLPPETARLRIYDDDFNPPELAPAPLGGAFVVPTGPGDNRAPRVALSPQGEAVVVWERQGPGGGVAARLFDRDGRPRGDEIRVRDAPPEGTVLLTPRPAVAFTGTAAGGVSVEGSDFLVVWHEVVPPFGEGRIFGRRYDGGGAPRGERFQVASCAAAGDPLCILVDPGARLARGADGRVVAVWQYRRAAETAVVRTLIDPDGGLAAESVTPLGNYADPTVAADADGNFVVAWVNVARGSLTARRFDAAGQPLGEPFDVVPPDPGLHLTGAPPEVAMADGGHFVATWVVSATGEPGPGILAQRVSRLDRPLGDPFRPPDFPFGLFFDPAIASDPAGNFFAVWHHDSPFVESPIGVVFGKRYNWRWGPIGGEFRIDDASEGFQLDPDVAVGRDGTAFVAWSQQLQDGNTVMARRFAPSHCVPGADRNALCLQDGRFRLEAEWRDFDGNVGRARAAGALTRDTGHFWFFGEDNVEIVAKVLDGRPVNGHYWVFYASLSNVEYTLKVIDTMTGLERRYHNPLGRFASAGDVEAFPGDDLGRGWPAAALPSAPVAAPARAPALAGSCVPGDRRLCLGGGRFELSVDWRDFEGATGSGHGVPLTAESGYFWFFGEENVEVVVKVLDGRPLTGHFWVFYGALSNVEYTLTVTDTVTGHRREYFNPAGRFASVGDTTALPGE